MFCLISKKIKLVTRNQLLIVSLDVDYRVFPLLGPNIELDLINNILSLGWDDPDVGVATIVGVLQECVEVWNIFHDNNYWNILVPESTTNLVNPDCDAAVHSSQNLSNIIRFIQDDQDPGLDYCVTDCCDVKILCLNVCFSYPSVVDS